MHSDAVSAIDNLLVKIDGTNASSSCSRVCNIRLHDLRWSLVELRVVTQIVEHELTLGVAPALVIQLIFFHSNLSINLVLLKISSNGRLPLVMWVVAYHHILI